MAGDNGEDEGEGESAYTAEQLPLAGVVLCCTSIPPDRRSALAATALEMGAQHKFDLTSDVTHLLVGDIDTPKYKYVARERPDVKCLLPEFIDAVRASWLDAEEIRTERIAALEREWTVPTLWNLKVCLTGFQEIAERKRIEEVVKREGAGYSGDLTKEVTHLICKEPKGQKYHHAKLWGIRVVGIEWLADSLRRGMVLEEALYDPSIEPQERGKGAWKEPEQVLLVAAKRPRDEDDAGTSATSGGAGAGAGAGAPVRKLRRTASAKFSSHNEGMWTDIVNGGSAPREERKGAWEDREEETSEENAKATETTPEIARTSSVAKETMSTSTTIPRGEAYPTTTRGVFAGKRFYLHGFDTKQTAVLERHLSSQNGQILPELSQLSSQSTLANSSGIASTKSSFMLVPHTLNSRQIPSSTENGVGDELSLEEAGVVTLTELWIEKCLLGGTLADAAYRPFVFPLPGFESLLMSTTGIVDIDLLHVGKIVKLLGARFDGQLTSNTSMLLCDNNVSEEREKVQHALRWDIPVVRIDWLWHCLSTGRKQPFHDYVLRPKGFAKGSDEQPKQRLFQDPFASGAEKQEGSSKTLRAASSPKVSNAKPAALSRRRSRSKSRGTFEADDAAESSSRRSTQRSETLRDDFIAHGEEEAEEETYSTANYAASTNGGQFQAQARSLPITPTAFRTRMLPLKERSPNSPLKHALSPSRFKLSPSSIALKSRKSSPQSAAGGASAYDQAPLFPELITRRSSRHGSFSRPSSRASADNNVNTKASDLSSAISSLLAARQNSAAATTVATSSSAGGRRRPRPLLGRASSNLSSRGIGSEGMLTRASSVDTLNTDGLGTPVEMAGPGFGGLALSRSGSGAGLGFGGAASGLDLIERGREGQNGDEVLADEAPEPPLTQVGYEDVEGGAWRAGLAQKLGWDKNMPGSGAQDRAGGDDDGGISRMGGSGVDAGSAVAESGGPNDNEDDNDGTIDAAEHASRGSFGDLGVITPGRRGPSIKYGGAVAAKSKATSRAGDKSVEKGKSQVVNPPGSVTRRSSRRSLLLKEEGPVEPLSRRTRFGGAAAGR